MEGKPKKRGRKTKTTDAYDVINVQQNNHSIINIKHQSVTEDTKQILPGYTKAYMDTTYEHCELCWNCCHSFHSIIHGIPLKYVDDIFYIYGDFCSLECGMRFAYENFQENKWEIYSLINLYHKKVLKDDNKINIPLSKLSLKIFGGSLTIDEYRKTFNKVGLHELIMPHIIPINHELESYENKIISTQDLKLYRKKPLKNDKQKITKILDN